MSKYTTDLGSHQTIRDAIQKISFHGFVNPETGSFRGTNKIEGFVAKIHTDGPLKGTIDVQERNTLAMSQGDDDVKVGYHEGVRLSAIQDNSKGYVIVPKLYSDVVISQDPDSYTEYVYMYSRVDFIQLDSHETISIGVKEREEYDEYDENAPVVRELEETGVYARTTYRREPDIAVITEVQGEEEEDYTQCIASSQEVSVIVGTDNKGSSVIIDKDKGQVVAGDDESSLLVNKDEVKLQHDKATMVLNDNQGMVECGNSSVQVKNGSILIDSGSGTEDSAVLGKALAGTLSDIVTAIMGMIITSPAGPCVIDPNTLTSLGELQVKLTSCQSLGNGEFLTNKVKIKG